MLGLARNPQLNRLVASLRATPERDIKVQNDEHNAHSMTDTEFTRSTFRIDRTVQISDLTDYLHGIFLDEQKGFDFLFLS